MATLLVVDDNPGNRDLLSRRLARKGFSVLAAEDGEKALEVLGSQAVDLVLLDVMMPGISGLEVLRRVRRMRSAAELPIIMVTARTESEDIVEALGLGANDYVTKPIDFPVVLARVEAHLRTLLIRREPAPAAPLSAAHIQPGCVLDGRYRLDSRVGSGNFGTVYRATHLELAHPVAVKVLQTTASTDPEALARFRREGVSACRVRHANAVSVLDFGVSPAGIAYLVMELLEGHSLAEELEQHGALDARRAAELVVPVCFALGEAHRAGIVHRDVKPSNIFLHRAATGQVPKVLDFGIATIVGDAALSQSLTLDGSLLGTPAYMAPERFRARSYGGQSDVYSVGIMLFQMLAGRLPFVTPHGDPMAVAMMQANDPPPSLRQINPAVPAAVERLVSLALRKSPEERPSADELGRSLAAAADLVVGRDLPVSSARPPIAVRPGSAQALTLRAGPYPPEAAVTPRPPARPARPPGARRPR